MTVVLDIEREIQESERGEYVRAGTPAMKLMEQQEIMNAWDAEDRANLNKSPYCSKCYTRQRSLNKHVDERKYYCTMQWLKDEPDKDMKTGKIASYHRYWKCRVDGGGKTVMILLSDYSSMEQK